MNAHEMHVLQGADVFDRSSRSLRILMWGCYSVDYEEYCMVCSPVDVHWCSRWTYASDQAQVVSQASYHQDAGLPSCLAFSSTLEIEAICSFKMSVNFYWATCVTSLQAMTI
jgi:hypothetical protein